MLYARLSPCALAAAVRLRRQSADDARADIWAHHPEVRRILDLPAPAGCDGACRLGWVPLIRRFKIFDGAAAFDIACGSTLAAVKWFIAEYDLAHQPNYANRNMAKTFASGRTDRHRPIWDLLGRTFVISDRERDMLVVFCAAQGNLALAQWFHFAFGWSNEEMGDMWRNITFCTNPLEMTEDQHALLDWLRATSFLV